MTDDREFVSARVLGATGPRADALAVEAPLEVRIGGKPAAVLMRTPGHDDELVAGFLFAEGVIADADELLGAERGAPNVIEARLAVARRAPAQRGFLTSSACGVCGKQSLADLEVRAPRVTSALRVPRSVLQSLPSKLRDAQPLFARTGGVHASALFTPAGELLAVREDVGRHNALDKLIGWALTEGRVPLTNFVLFASGRLSFELVQKAIAAGAPVLAGVGAPSSLAVELAERFGVTLAGFVREDGLNVYSHAERLLE
jgi:FdhD protein